MTHHVLGEYYSTDHKWHKQGDTKLLKLINKYLVMVTFEYSKKVFSSIRNFEIMAHYSIHF